jgi:ubiquitin-protein ligase
MPRVPEDLRPGWDKDFPGLLDWEIAELEKIGSNVEIDQDQLKRGFLVVTFDWPFTGASIPLKASFPPSYPHLRPHVQLLTERDTWPTRHVAPNDGTICLLGRDSMQWTSELTLAQLLVANLDSALNGTGSEDPQGEPAEVWWNSVAPIPGSYFLVDSSWDLGSATQGTLEVLVALGGHGDLLPGASNWPPPIHAVVNQVFSEAGSTIARWTRPIPPEIANSPHREVRIRWRRVPDTILPAGDVRTQLLALQQELFGSAPSPVTISSEVAMQAYAIVHPIEIGHNVQGHGWIVSCILGAPRDLAQGKPKQQPKQKHQQTAKRNPPVGGLLPVMRAGELDVAYRVPAVNTLKSKRIAVFGVGAIGAPLAIDLARNGCSHLHLIDNDIVEPGNSIRWPLGAGAWGRHKVAALGAFIESQYPTTAITPHNHQLGSMSEPNDDTLLDGILSCVDLVVDGTASYGVNTLLWHKCQARSLPLIRLSATPTVKGGTVVRHALGGGCPVCLIEARDAGAIKSPPGANDSDDLRQPPGCAERTFLGADYDLVELSLQAMRLVIETLGADKPVMSVVMTLSLVDEMGNTIPPSWAVEPLSKCIDCCGKGG